MSRPVTGPRVLRFFVPGDPRGQPRARSARAGLRSRVYTPRTACDGWKESVRLEALRAMAGGAGGPPFTRAALSVVFRVQRPAGHLRADGGLRASAPVHHTGKPDLDNALKAVMDALTETGVWNDDTAVDRVSAAREWAGDGRPAGAVVEVSGTHDGGPRRSWPGATVGLAGRKALDERTRQRLLKAAGARRRRR